MNKTVKVILGIAITVMVCVIIGIVVSLSYSKKLDNFPQSTLSHEAGGEMTYIPSEILTKEISFPTLPLRINFPENLVAGTDTAIVANYSGYRVVAMESADTLENALMSDLNTVGVEAISNVSVDFKSGIYDSGYINSWYAEYIGGRSEISHDGESSVLYGVSYRLAVSDEKNLMLYVSSENLESLNSAKNLLDALVYTIRPDSEEVTEKKKEAGITSPAVSGVAGNTEAAPSNENAKNAEEIEFMETTEVPVYGQITPEATADKEIYLEKDYEDMVIVFGWTNISKVPTSVKVTDPDGKEYECDNTLSHRGGYVYLIGKAKQGDTYRVSIETMDSIYGCTYYPMEYTDFIREMYPDDEELLEQRGGAPAETDEELSGMAPPADENGEVRSQNGNNAAPSDTKTDTNTSSSTKKTDDWEDDWQ